MYMEAPEDFKKKKVLQMTITNVHMGQMVWSQPLCHWQQIEKMLIYTLHNSTAV